MRILNQALSGLQTGLKGEINHRRPASEVDPAKKNRQLAASPLVCNQLSV
jgi:hypothetical protein